MKLNNISNLNFKGRLIDYDKAKKREEIENMFMINSDARRVLADEMDSFVKALEDETPDYMDYHVDFKFLNRNAVTSFWCLGSSGCGGLEINVRAKSNSNQSRRYSNFQEMIITSGYTIQAHDDKKKRHGEDETNLEIVDWREPADEIKEKFAVFKSQVIKESTEKDNVF